MKASHLVILKKPYVEAILAGRKTIESRFMKNKRPPYRRVQSGDRLFLKVSSGPVCAVADVERVEYFEDLTPERILELKGCYNQYILGSRQYWREKSDCRFGFLA